MGSAYAGRLGLVAFLTAIGRGLLHADPPEEIVGWATLALVVFAAIGFVAGQWAGWIVEDSVRASLTAEMALREAAGKQPVAGKS